MVGYSKDTMVNMPRYLIINKAGKIVETSAAQPSDQNVVSRQLDKYLAFN